MCKSFILIAHTGVGVSDVAREQTFGVIMPAPAMPPAMPPGMPPDMPPEVAAEKPSNWMLLFTFLFEASVLFLGFAVSCFVFAGLFIWLEPRIFGTSNLYLFLVKIKLHYDKIKHEYDSGRYFAGAGDMYKGDLNKKGQRHGRGSYIYANGCIYEGQWKNDLSHGQGKCSEANGNVYSGQHKNGQAHGQGKYTWADGNAYQGEWVSGEMQGKGKYFYSNGVIYEGQFKANKRHGRGSQKEANGDKVEGEWEDDKYLHSLVVSDALKALRSMPSRKTKKS